MARDPTHQARGEMLGLARAQPNLQARRRGKRMKRRDIILGLGATAAVWPLATRALQKVPVIGFLGTTSPAAWPIAAFERRLGELGWVSGRTITIDYRWTEGRNEKAPAIAEAFVRARSTSSSP